jgi:hypothetical protein
MFESIDRGLRNVNSVWSNVVLLSTGALTMEEVSLQQTENPLTADEANQLSEVLQHIGSFTNEGDKSTVRQKLMSAMHLYEQHKITVEKFEEIFNLTPCGYSYQG